MQTAEFLIAIGCMLMLGLAADALGRRTFLPRVTLLLACGVAIGDDALAILPASVTESFDLFTSIALMMVGFLLGGKLTRKSLRRAGRQMLAISIGAALGATLIVTASLTIASVPPELAVLLGCIAAATAPAATIDTVLESGREGPFARLLLAIVAIDDAWALVLFSLGLAAVSFLNGAGEFSSVILDAGREVIGALLLGGAIGLPAAYLTGRIRPGKPMLTEAIGLVLLCGGAALWLDVSFLLATMAMGAMIANVAIHHEFPFHEIENIEWPFMVVFFMLAGASLDLEALPAIGLLGILYIAARVAGKLLGAELGARFGDANPEVRRWIGIALLPQAGVAIGMALLAGSQFPEHQDRILTLVIASTVFFELVGPVFTRMALKRAGDIRSSD